MIVQLLDYENYYIHGRNPQLPEESVLRASGETLMKEEAYRVGGVQGFPVQVIL